MIIDTHAHLDFPDYNKDLDEVLRRAEEIGVEYIINVGIDVKSSNKSINLAGRYNQFFASIGIHPNEAANVSKEDWSQIESLAKQDKVVAIGETGLDYYRNRSEKGVQQRLFKLHLDLAERERLPVIIHNRDASDDCLEVLRPYKSKIEGVIHCFSGSKEVAGAVSGVGFPYFFCGTCYFPKSNFIEGSRKNGTGRETAFGNRLSIFGPAAAKG